MSSYLTSFSTKQTPQSQPIPGEKQVKNSAGGYAYGIDKFSHLQRFLILGSEGGSYYASQDKLTRENANIVLACIKEDGLRTVRIVTEISVDGRAPKNDPAIFALALASVEGDEATRKAAYEALPKVCRIGTHLFTFAEFREQFGGWGRGVRTAVGNWYLDKPEDKLAYQAIKYRQRNGWSHRDLLRLAHPKADTPQQNALLRYIAGKDVEDGTLPKIIDGFEQAQRAENPKATASLIRQYNLPREALQTEHLKDPQVWAAMLDQGMPITALVRNLATMTRNGTFDDRQRVRQAAEQIADGDLLFKGRVHPLSILIAMRTYQAGRSLRGSGTWNPISQIVDALDAAFYAAFGNIEKTDGSRLLALDISGSMWSGFVAGVPGFTPAEATAAMAMVSMRSCADYEVVCFAGGGYYHRTSAAPNQTNVAGLSTMDLSPRQRLDDVGHRMRDMSRYMGGTDCALPMIWAEKNKKKFDVIEVFTDSETWAGNIHPSQALRSYRKASGLNTKLVVYGMVSNGFSIADPNDPGMLDVVGFDTAVPNLVAAFVEGGF